MEAERSQPGSAFLAEGISSCASFSLGMAFSDERWHVGWMAPNRAIFL
jgi:hypothetical protein